MRNFHDCSAKDGAARLLTLAGKLAVLGEKTEPNPLSLLREEAVCILDGDCMGAFMKHAALTRALAASPARRISGGMFADYLIYLAVERDHSFALSAALGMLDEAELMLFRSDLAALGELSLLEAGDLARMAVQRARELSSRGRYARDEISVMSTAAWGGTDPKTVQRRENSMQGAAPAPLQPPAEGDWPDWNYGEKGLRGEYAADEVLEEIYISLTESENWKSVAQDLFNLFASSGTGVLLKTRLLDVRANENGVYLAPAAQGECAVQLSFQERAKQALSDSVISFMRGSKPECVLLFGPEAMGKATLAKAMADEFPELRLVTAHPMSANEAEELFALLGAQPLRFMLLMENADSYSPAWRPLLNACTGSIVPKNVLCVATSGSAAGFAGFPIRIELGEIDLDAFAKAAEELAAARAPYIETDSAWIRNAAVDYRLDPHDEFNAASASLIASRFIAERE